MFDFDEELKKLPNAPGVYLMHDGNDTIIYVGKAVNLHNRVRSYFRKIVATRGKTSRYPRYSQIIYNGMICGLSTNRKETSPHAPCHQEES